MLLFKFLRFIGTLYLINQVSGAAPKNSTSRGIFYNPIREDSWPDPYCYLHTDGFYYMPRREHSLMGIVLFKSATLHNWRHAEKSMVYLAPPGLMNLWAPEIFFIGGEFYIYFALDDGENANHRMYVTRAVNSSDPMRGGWTQEKRLIPPGDDFWAIDGTVMEYGEELYFIWSGWPTLNAGFPQNIYIAQMSDPETISSSRVLINEPTYSWQMHGEPLLEGPQILQKGGRTFLVYSCSGSWTADYQLGIMGIDDMKDPLNPENWWRHDQPVFWRNNDARVYGTGHASFTTSKDRTESWLVYHAMADPNGGWGNRTTRVQKFDWNPDNFPRFPRPVGLSNPLETPSGE